jgi:peptidoglycan/xylan/chitin deacetylase (PgdA/CDA1 family)
MHRGTLCLTFDFDAISLWISRSMLSATPVSRGEFGAFAIPRLLNLLEVRGISSTWFIPGHTIETYRSLCQEVVAAGHEVALHGYAHENAGTLSPEAERDMFRRAFDLIADLTGKPPQGNRTPAWDLTPHTLGILEELGVHYDSSLMSTDYTPFYARAGDEIPLDGPTRFGRTTNLVELPVSWSLDDYPHFEYLRGVLPGFRAVDAVYQNWLQDLQYMVRDFDRGVAVVTFHPQAIGRGHRLLGLERWLDAAAELPLSYSRLDAVAADYRGGAALGVYDPAAGSHR